MQNDKKRRTAIMIAFVPTLAAVILAGFGVFRLATKPTAPANIFRPQKSDITALYREKSRGKAMTSRLDTVVGSPENPSLLDNGSESVPATNVRIVGTQTKTDANPLLFSNRERILTTEDVYALLQTDLSLQRELQIRALIKLSLSKNCDRVQYAVEYVSLPIGGITTLEAYVASQPEPDDVRGQGGYTLEYSADWASRVLGKEIKETSSSRAAFAAFMKEMETYVPSEALIVPGTGRAALG
jgi:hypothetical protein